MPHSSPESSDAAEAPADDGGRSCPRRVVIDPGGPVLVEGPVEVDLPDGRTVRSDRFMVALCACRRSRAFPWCDTSHRRHGGQRRESQRPEE